MKKAIRLSAFILVAVMLVSAIPLSGSAASALDGKTIICFGDSLTEGTYYWETNGLSVYSDYLAENFPDSAVINAGARGNSTYDALLRYEADVIAKNPDIVIICFGMNDQAWEVQYDRPIQTLEKYTSQLTTMITDIQAAGADVILVTPNPVYEAAYTPTAYNNYEYGLMPQYCDAMRKLAIGLDCGLVDINYEITERGVSAYVSSDGIHQTAAGHQLYADCITAYLKAAYDGVNKATMTVEYKTENGNKVGSAEFAGAAGARITLPVPALEGHTAVSSEIKTAFVDGASHSLTYSSELEKALDRARSQVAVQYGENVIDEIRALCARGEGMLSPDNETFSAEDMAKAATRINAAIEVKGENILNKSLNASYERTAPNYYFQGDTSDTRYFDDNSRLTDGIKSTASGENTGGNNYYSAWSGNVEITLDLGEVTETNVYKAYVAGCSSWGITAPGTISVAHSENGTSFTPVTATVSSEPVTAGEWNTFAVTAESKSTVSARYIKITIPGGFVWVDEVEAALHVKPLEDIVYINGFNSSIVDSDARIFTSDFGNLSSANLKYTANLVAEWDDAQSAYCVTEVFEGNGEEVNRVLGDDEILIAVHYGTSIPESGDAYNLILGAEEGQIINFNGVDMENNSVQPLSFITLAEGADIVPDPDFDINADGRFDMYDYMLVKSIYFGKYEPTEGERTRADVYADGNIDMYDYLQIKAAYFA